MRFEPIPITKHTNPRAQTTQPPEPFLDEVLYYTNMDQASANSVKNVWVMTQALCDFGPKNVWITSRIGGKFSNFVSGLRSGILPHCQGSYDDATTTGLA